MELTVSGLMIGASAVGGFLASLVGGFDILISTLVLFMVMDIVLGISMSLYKHKSKKTESGGYSSEALYKGITRKFLSFAVIIIAVALDNLTGLYITAGGMQVTVLRSMVCVFYILYEASSILENICLLGVPLPKRLLDVLDVMKKEYR